MVFSKSPEIKWCTLCAQSNSTTLQVHVYRHIVIVYPLNLDDHKSWDYLARWTNRDFPNPNVWLPFACGSMHVPSFYYLGFKNWSFYLKTKINYSSTITIHTIYIHKILQMSRYQNQTINQITICISPDKITTVA